MRVRGREYRRAKAKKGEVAYSVTRLERKGEGANLSFISLGIKGKKKRPDRLRSG